MQLLLQKHSLENLTRETSEQTMTLEIDPVLASYRLQIDCFTVRQDGVMVRTFTGVPHSEGQRDRNGTKTQRDDATNKTHDSG